MHPKRWPTSKPACGVNVVAANEDLSHYDLVIVGGGLVGHSLACACSGLGLRIALLEQKPLQPSPKPLQSTLHSASANPSPSADSSPSPSPNPNPSSSLGSGSSSSPTPNARAIALSLSSVHFFKALGLWSRLEAATSPIQTIHVSSKGHFGRTVLRAAEHQLPLFGTVIDADVLLHCLETESAGLADVTLLPRAAAWSEVCALPNTLVVAADGTQSELRTQAGIGHTVHDYHQVAVVCNVELSQPHHHNAYERFTAQGPLAMLPFGERRVKCVWVVPADCKDEMLNLNEADYLAKIQSGFGHRLGRLQSVGPRSAYPLKQVVADRVTAERFVLLGNAAATLHPVAAQGLNLALRDVATLAEILRDAKKLGEPIGSRARLQQYAALRAADQKGIMWNTHQLVQIFESEFWPVQIARQWGMVACDVIPPLQQWIVQRGSGTQGVLPQLSRGVPLVNRS